jgi:hypothetical protein
MVARPGLQLIDAVRVGNDDFSRGWFEIFYRIIYIGDLSVPG